MAGSAERLGVADLHAHTAHSDGSDGSLNVLYCARRVGLDVVAITDHDTVEGALEAAELAARLGGPEVVVGEEVSSREGHILGLFLRYMVEPGLTARETVTAIHEQGGLAVAAHPYWRVGAAVPNGDRYSVSDLVFDLGFDAIEAINGTFTPSMAVANVKAGRVARELGLAEVGGSDAHARAAVGSAYTVFRGQTSQDLRRSLLMGDTRAGRSRAGLRGVPRYAFSSIRRVGV